MLGTRGSVLGASGARTLSAAEEDAALEVCARDPRTSVFVASRIIDGSVRAQPGSLLGFGDGDRLESICWAGANVVPVAADRVAIAAYEEHVRPLRRRCCSLFGPAQEVLQLWAHLRPTWGQPRAIRERQPLLALDAGTLTPEAELPRDPQVRPARPAEADLVVPAAAAMFTEEIGYSPYHGSAAGYRRSVAALIDRGHTFVRLEQGRVVFKADVGSAALGVAQIQGVWVHPHLRGRGLAAPAMASVADQVRATIAPVVTLYVNDFNIAARRTYARVGFRAAGTFATVLL